jgi:hypothetical protein
VVEVPYAEVALTEKEMEEKMKSLEKATVMYKPFVLENNI